LKLEKLLGLLPETYSVIDREMIARAYHTAEEVHADQKRAAGEPYSSHCLATAIILAELKVSPTMIAAGLLHDAPLDTKFSLADIRREFGDEIGLLVEGVCRLTNIPNITRADQHLEIVDSVNARLALVANADPPSNNRRVEQNNEAVRKLFLSMGDDVRIVVIKLAEHLHNMRTLGALPDAFRLRIAQQTLDVFAPLANRLGIWQIKWELEDLAFRHINPEKFKEISDKLADRREDREQQVRTIIGQLKKVMGEANIEADISGRPKHIYSIYRKMVDKGKPFEMVRDLRGVRLIVPDVPTCYMALGIIHTRWRPIPNEFDDYIAVPKENNYQSLHTAVIYDDGKPLEVQIRSREMHENAEYGIASHWRYKEKGLRTDQSYEQRVNWLRRLLEWRSELEDSQDALDGMKGDVFQDRVYVFTPRGDIIDMPANATPIDFAYHVHTEIGHRCRGARINGKLVSLDYCLKTGDQVEILTAKQGGPSRDWLNSALGLVRTSRARAKIRSWFVHQDREHNLSQGKAMLERELKRLALTNIDLEKLARTFDYPGSEELFVALGSGSLAIGRVVHELSEEDLEQRDQITQGSAGIRPSSAGLSVTGLKGLLTTIARCCNPAPGDEVIGYITQGRGATIHRVDCPNLPRLAEISPDRLIKVSWGETPHTYPVDIEIKAYDRQGLMAEISTILDNENINVRDIQMHIAHNLATIRIMVDVRDIAQLSRVLTRLENIPNVMEAHRTRPG